MITFLVATGVMCFVVPITTYYTVRLGVYAWYRARYVAKKVNRYETQYWKNHEQA